MANRTSQRGGLYHYSAKSLNHPNVQAVIRQMANDMTATEWFVTTAWVDPMFPAFGQGSDAEDVAEVIQFVKGCAGSRTKDHTEDHEPRVGATFYWEKGVPVYNGMDFRPPGRSGGIAKLEETYSIKYRKLDGDVWYYGANCDMRFRWTQVVTTDVATSAPRVESKAPASSA